MIGCAEALVGKLYLPQAMAPLPSAACAIVTFPIPACRTSRRFHTSVVLMIGLMFRGAPLLTAVAALVAGSMSQAQQSGLQAMEVLTRAKGTATGQRIVVVAGENGAEQPETWRLVVRGPPNANQLWEFSVRGGRLIAEQPLPPSADAVFSGAPLVRTKLKIDSPVVFWRAHTEAEKARVGFDTVDYGLRNAELSTTPVWVARLNNQAGQQVGELTISAETGQVLRRTWMTAPRGTGSRSTPPVATTPANSPASADPAPTTEILEEKAKQAWDGTRSGWHHGKRAVQSGLRKAGDTVGGWFRRANDGPLIPPPPPAPASP